RVNVRGDAWRDASRILLRLHVDSGQRRPGLLRLDDSGELAVYVERVRGSISDRFLLRSSRQGVWLTSVQLRPQLAHRRDAERFRRTEPKRPLELLNCAEVHPLRRVDPARIHVREMPRFIARGTRS